MAAAQPSANLAERINALIDQSAVDFINESFESIWDTLEPYMAVFLVVYIVIFGLLIFRGRVQIPVQEFLEGVVKFSIIYAFVSSWSLFSAQIVDFFTNTPDAIAGMISDFDNSEAATEQLGIIYNDTVQTIEIVFSNSGRFQKYFLGGLLTLASGLMLIYALFLVLLSKIAIALLIGVAPIFIILLMFDVTKMMFEAWLRQLITYILTIAFAVAVLGLTSDILSHIQSITPNDDIELGHIIPLCIIYFLITLLLAQVQDIASSIAGGASVSTQNMGHSAASYGLRKLDSLRRKTMDGAKDIGKRMLKSKGKGSITPKG